MDGARPEIAYSFRGLDPVEMVFSNVNERDIDRIVMFALKGTPGLAQWVGKQAGLHDAHLSSRHDSVRQRIEGRTMEVDILVCLECDGRNVAVLIENKLKHKLSSAQAEGYVQARVALRNAGYDDVRTCLLAPSSYMERCAEAGRFDCRITYESLAERFPLDSNSYELLNRKTIQQAIRKADLLFDPATRLMDSVRGRTRIEREMKRIMDALPGQDACRSTDFGKSDNVAFRVAATQLARDGLVFHFPERYVQDGDGDILMRVYPTKASPKHVAGLEDMLLPAIDSDMTVALAQMEQGLRPSPGWAAKAHVYGLIDNDGSLTTRGSELTEAYLGMLDRFGMRFGTDELAEWSREQAQQHDMQTA